MIALSGVRSSWLMLATNALLVRLASSAASLAIDQLLLDALPLHDLLLVRLRVGLDLPHRDSRSSSA